MKRYLELGVIVVLCTLLSSFGSDRKEVMLKNLGKPAKVEDDFLYYYPDVSISSQELVGTITLGEPVGMGGCRDEL